MVSHKYVYDGSTPIWISCAWENGPVCYGLVLDIVGGAFLLAFAVLAVGVSFFGWFDIKPKTIRRKIRD